MHIYYQNNLQIFSVSTQRSLNTLNIVIIVTVINPHPNSNLRLLSNILPKKNDVNKTVNANSLS